MADEATVVVGVGPLDLAQVVAVARTGARVAISTESQVAIDASRAHVELLARSGKPVYGVSTGFGALSTKYIEPELRSRLQRSLIRSHAAGSGPCVEREVVRALMLLRLSTLCSGRTGVRAGTAQAYADLLNAGITPCVPEYGSLGCSGDLAPLAHCALALMGEGEVFDAEGTLTSSAAGSRGRRADSRRARGEGGPRAHQRHGRHARHAVSGPRRPGPAGHDCRHRGRDERRGASGDRPRLRLGPSGAAASARPGGLGAQHEAAARGLRPRRVPRDRGPARAGRLLAAVRPAGGGRRCATRSPTRRAWRGTSSPRRSTTPS